jgi:hypothetical protein
MQISVSDFTERVAAYVKARGVPNSTMIAEACAHLEACGYPGLTMLQEALRDSQKELSVVKDILGVDLKNVSCVFLMAQLAQLVEKSGRVYLRNVRHGLYLLPDSVASNYGIGCPVDPSFHLGGDRTKNPYAEKWDAALAGGIAVDEAVWAGLLG